VTSVFALLIFASGPAAGDTAVGFPARIDALERHIYVGNATTNTITIYDANANGNVAPVRTIGGPNTGISCLRQIAADELGDVYVANFGPCPGMANAGRSAPLGSVLVFASNANGNVAPVRTIAGPSTRIKYCTAVAVDTDGTVYVGTSNGPFSSLLRFAPGAAGNVPPLRSLFENYVVVDGLTLNPGAGLLASYSGTGQAHQFFGVAYVNKSFPGIKEAIFGHDPGPLAADPATHTFLALEGGFSFPSPASTAYRFADGTTGYFNGPGGGSAFVPPPLSSFSITTCPVAIAIGHTRTIYVAGQAGSNCAADTISSFAPNATGNAVPFRQISGPATQLAAPTYVTIGP
jgi:hypothetical protein